MPIEPKYYRQQRLPGRLGAGYASPQVFSTAEKALGELGKTLAYRGHQMEERHDESKIASGYNDYRDIARTKLSELFKLKGENATGLGARFDEWFNEFVSDYTEKRLGNTRQRKGFYEAVMKRRGHDLDALAVHEAKEMAAFQQQAEDGLFTTTVDDIAARPFDINAAKTSIDFFFNELKGMRSGEDIAALKDKYEKQFYASMLQAQINRDPQSAAPFLEEWRNLIGPDAYKQFKDQLKEGVTVQNIDAAHAKLEQMFGNDAAAKLKYIGQRKNWKKLGLTDVNEKSKLKAIINGEYEANKALREEYEAQRDKDQLLAFQDALFVDKNIKNAWVIADAMEDANMRGKALALVENQKYASDPDKYTELKRLVNLDPGSIDERDIWGFLPSAPGEPGVSPDHLEAAQKRWESLMKEAEENPDKYSIRSLYHKSIDRLRNNGVFSDSHRVNEVIANRHHDELNTLMDSKPEITEREVEDWFKKRTAGYESSSLKRFLHDVLPSIFGPDVEADILKEEELFEDEAKRILTNAGKVITEESIKKVVERLKARAGIIVPKETPEELTDAD